MRVGVTVRVCSRRDLLLTVRSVLRRSGGPCGHLPTQGRSFTTSVRGPSSPWCVFNFFMFECILMCCSDILTASVVTAQTSNSRFDPFADDSDSDDWNEPIPNDPSPRNITAHVNEDLPVDFARLSVSSPPVSRSSNLPPSHRSYEVRNVSGSTVIHHW